MISMKMEIPENAWKEDPCGINLANFVNSKLPDHIKIFSILPSQRYLSIFGAQNVLIILKSRSIILTIFFLPFRSFDARRECSFRLYSYLVPAKVIGIKEDSSPDEINHHLFEFNEILRDFEVLSLV